MRSQTKTKQGRWLCGLALVLFSTSLARADAPPVSEPSVKVGPAGVEVDVEALRPSEYWIGLLCSPMPDKRRADVDVPEGRGLLVLNVVPDSPAAEAGIKRHDILVKAGDTPLEEIKDLIDAIDAAKDKGLTIEVYRDGTSTKIDVVPAKRPDDRNLFSDWVPFPGWRDWAPPGSLDTIDPALREKLSQRAREYQEALKEWIESIRPDVKEPPPMRFRFFHPGTILPPGPSTAPLPEEMTVIITKQGDNPATVEVTRNDEKWEVAEDELDKLPEDVRPHVERMLGRAWRVAVGKGGILGYDVAPQRPPRKELRDEVPEKLRPQTPLEKQIQEMRHQLDEMRKSIDELRKNRPRLKDADAKQRDV